MNDSKTGRIINTFIFIVLIICILFVYSKYIGTKGLVVKEYRVKSEILTSNFNGIKIVHVSDLLYKSTVDKKDVENIVERINLINPDIVVFTGNLVTNTTKITTEDTNFLVNALSNIQLPNLPAK